MALKARADVANAAVRIFLQDFGVAYDELRELPKYQKRKHFGEVKSFFGGAATAVSSSRGLHRRLKITSSR